MKRPRKCLQTRSERRWSVAPWTALLHLGHFAAPNKGNEMANSEQDNQNTDKDQLTHRDDAIRMEGALQNLAQRMDQGFGVIQKEFAEVKDVLREHSGVMAKLLEAKVDLTVRLHGVESRLCELPSRIEIQHSF